MTRPCSSACTRCSSPGFFRYALSLAGVGLCSPDVGGCDLYFWIFKVCPRPSSFGLCTVQPAAFAAASRSLILRPGIDPSGQEPDDPPVALFEPLSPPEASAIAATAITTAPTSAAATA